MVDKELVDKFSNLLSEIKAELFGYINSYLKISLDKHPIKDFLSFRLIDNDKENKVEKILSFSENKEEYYKVLWNVLSKKNKYNNFNIQMYISDYVVRYTSNGIIDFFRNNTEILNLLIKSLKDENFLNKIKPLLEETYKSKTNVVNDLLSVIDPNNDDSDPSSVGIVINLLDRVLASENLRTHIESKINESDISLRFGSGLLKDLYEIMKIDIMGTLFITFLPVIISGILVGAVNFKKSIINYIQQSITSKLEGELELLSEMFLNEEFKNKTSSEMYSIIKSDIESSSETAEFIETYSESTANKKIRVSNIFAYMKVMAAMMWADGKLREEEIQLWKKITTLDLGLSTKQIRELEEWFKEGPNINIIGSEISDDNEQRFVTRQAMLMSMIDGEVDSKEIELIHFLADEFDISNEELESLESEAKRLLLID